ncbi:MAG: type II toxin-antitoxin system ParD family antitoxin [Pseudomonadota bacterium]
MHISLTETLEAYVREKVATGLYNNASEVIREALRLKIATDETEEARREKLLEAIDLGWQQAERGECVPFDLDDVLSRLDAD